MRFKTSQNQRIIVRDSVVVVQLSGCDAVPLKAPKPNLNGREYTPVTGMITNFKSQLVLYYYSTLLSIFIGDIEVYQYRQRATRA